MRESAEDFVELQQLLDRSYASAGPHLLEIHTTDKRLSAQQLAERLTAVRVLALATVTADGRPLVGPVDGIFYRGRFSFGTGIGALRVAHVRRNPAVSAVHSEGEAWAVTVHGTAVERDPQDDEFAEVCREIYGDGWEDWGESAVYFEIEPRAMFTFALE
jgi:hypothetical protein